MTIRNKFLSLAQRAYSSTTSSPEIYITNKGFSEISFITSQYTVSGFRMLIDVVADLCDAVMSLKKGKHFVILTRFVYQDGSVRTLHKSVRIALNANFENLFYRFLVDILSMKSNDYSIETQSIVKITVNFFWVTGTIRVPDPPEGGGRT